MKPFRGTCAVSSVVEHYLDTVGVRGSNPLSRTISFIHRSFLSFMPGAKGHFITRVIT